MMKMPPMGPVADLATQPSVAPVSPGGASIRRDAVADLCFAASRGSPSNRGRNDGVAADQNKTDSALVVAEPHFDEPVSAGQQNC